MSPLFFNNQEKKRKEGQGFVKEMEGERESDRDCPSWRSLLGAGSVFGSAHCIISISPNLPEQMEKGPTCSTSCIIKSFCLCAQRVYCTRSLAYITVNTDSFRCTLKHTVPIRTKSLSPAFYSSKPRHAHTCTDPEAGPDQYKHPVCFIR